MTAEIADLIISSNFYNNKLAQWEPMIVNWQLLVSVKLPVFLLLEQILIQFYSGEKNHEPKTNKSDNRFTQNA